jgi:hypothetical protein
VPLDAVRFAHDGVSPAVVFRFAFAPAKFFYLARRHFRGLLFFAAALYLGILDFLKPSLVYLIIGLKHSMLLSLTRSLDTNRQQSKPQAS